MISHGSERFTVMKAFFERGTVRVPRSRTFGNADAAELSEQNVLTMAPSDDKSDDDEGDDYLMSNGLNLHFVNVDVEEAYGIEIRKDAMRVTRGFSLWLVFFAFIIVFESGLLNVLFEMYADEEGEVKKDAAHKDTGLIDVAFLAGLILLRIFSRYIPVRHSEFVMLVFQIFLQLTILMGNRHRLAHLGILDYDINDEHEISEAHISMRIASLDSKIAIAVFALMSCFFSMAQVRSKFSWLVPHRCSFDPRREGVRRLGV